MGQKGDVAGAVENRNIASEMPSAQHWFRSDDGTQLETKKDRHSRKPLTRSVLTRNKLPQLRVLDFHFFQDRDVGVGIVPKSEEMQVSLARAW